MNRRGRHFWKEEKNLISGRGTRSPILGEEPRWILWVAGEESDFGSREKSQILGRGRRVRFWVEERRRVPGRKTIIGFGATTIIGFSGLGRNDDFGF